MTYGKIEIKKEDYKRLMEMTSEDRRAEIKSRIPDDIRIGYGLYCYGTRVDVEEGKYYITYTCGDSCD